MKNNILKEILDSTPPATLYHYTTQQGLIGIIKQKAIWATHTQYLNDRLEYLHAVDLVRNEIKSKREKSTEDLNKKRYDLMIESIDGTEQINVCVCSFSEVRDSLSQWRAYGEASSGYAIGFPGQFLKQVSQSTSFSLVQCVYDREKQMAIVHALIEKSLEDDIASEDKDDIAPTSWIAGYLYEYAPILKDASFSEEREWRLISRPLSCSSEGFHFRPGHSMIIPYYELPLSTTESSLTVDEIVVGPTPNPNQSRQSVLNLLVSEDLHYRDGNIRHEEMVFSSAVPYRAW